MTRLPLRALAGLGALALTMMPATAANYSASLKAGKAELKSAGPLAFGPDGILFIADTASASVLAVDTNDAKAGQPVADIQGISEKIARSLLLHGFVIDLLEKVKLPLIRDYVDQLISERLEYDIS